MSKTITLSFKCDEEYKARIDTLCESTGKTITEVLRGCVTRGATIWMNDIKKQSVGIPQ